MVKLGMKPTPNILSNLIVAHSKVSPADAARLYKKLKELKEELHGKLEEEKWANGTVHMYSKYASSLLANRNVEASCAVVEDMIQAKLRPNIRLCMKILVSAVDLSDSKSCSTALAWLEAHNTRIEQGLCMRLLRVAANKKDVLLATQTWNLMTKTK